MPLNRHLQYLPILSYPNPSKASQALTIQVLGTWKPRLKKACNVLLVHYSAAGLLLASQGSGKMVETRLKTMNL